MIFMNGSKVTVTYEVGYITISSEDGESIGKYIEEGDKILRKMRIHLKRFKTTTKCVDEKLITFAHN